LKKSHSDSPAADRLTLREITAPDDPHLAGLSRLMERVFADPNTVLGLDRLAAFLSADPQPSRRHFHVLAALDGSDHVVGGSVFSYVPRSNCGFSEYIVSDASMRGVGLGRRLFDRRKAILDADARERGQQRCRGLFIEADDPERTPEAFVVAERHTALDPSERLRLFDHLGFLRVDVPYVQPPLAPGKQPIDYLDLLFAPWQPGAADQRRMPAAWIFDTLAPVWSAWSPATRGGHLATLRQNVLTDQVALEPLAQNS
jgi:hypothetical protein